MKLPVRTTRLRTASAGMTLVEVMVALVILTVAVYLLSSTITAAIAHSDVKRERALAVEAAMNQIERMHSEPFQELFAVYNGDPSDDPLGPGTAAGRHFAVEGLNACTGDPDGLPGEVVVPSTAAGGLVMVGAGPKLVLREDATIAELGLPRDLNGDVLIDDRDHAEDYILLPVIVRVTWEGRGGRREIAMPTILARLEKLEL